MSAAERIRAAEARGEEWVRVEEAGDERAFRAVDLHLPTGVAVVWGWAPGDDGRPAYFTESLFRDRRTGGELPCGSRRWNVGVFASRAELEEAVARARADVRERFAGMIRIYERRRGSQTEVEGA